MLWSNKAGRGCVFSPLWKNCSAYYHIKGSENARSRDFSNIPEAWPKLTGAWSPVCGRPVLPCRAFTLGAWFGSTAVAPLLTQPDAWKIEFNLWPLHHSSAQVARCIYLRPVPRPYCCDVYLLRPLR